ncbi:lysine--tRNA ligase [Buchnera aphidicola]|uniref:lysine--tRNA ligase n=1 Tax=Buchnera aphidicola TaxID=9 RepID=UPI0034641A53
MSHKNNINENHTNTCNEYEMRNKKLNQIRKQGFNFPNNFKPNTNINYINKKYTDKSNTELHEKKIEIQIAGRMMKQRIMGKASFITLKDMNEEIQIYVTEKKISLEIYQNKFKKWDLGDILGVQGVLFKTKTNELSIYCEKIYLLSKSLRPLPNKFHGLLDKEMRYRRRYLDLITNKNSIKIFQKRSKILTIIRNFMEKYNFIEVETPMMQNIPGGATARPFITYHNSLNTKMYLRISPELYLKRLIIGGFKKIYEINRNFRNEGISSKHNPEFTMMELYMAYSNYKDLMEFTEKLLKVIIKTTLGSYNIKYHKYLINFYKPFKIFTMKESIIHFNPNIHESDLKELKKIQNIALQYDIKIQKTWSIGKITTKIFEVTTEKKIIQPTFITEYPIEVSPLAKRNNQYKNIADRFELFIGGMEIGNGFSELNDPEEQKSRFLKQNEKHYNPQEEKTFYDKEYIIAMEYGLPPTSGLGIGIDRLIMLITNQKNIRDVILFPTLRPV